MSQEVIVAVSPQVTVVPKVCHLCSWIIIIEMSQEVIVAVSPQVTVVPKVCAILFMLSMWYQ